MASLKIPEQKVILVGDFGVGKSSLFRRFMCDTFVSSSDRKATLGSFNYSVIILFESQLLSDFRIGPLLKDVSNQRPGFKSSALRHRR